MAKQFHLADLFETVAATVPDRIAIRAASATLTYAELNDRAERLAAGLATNGVTRGDTVGLFKRGGVILIGMGRCSTCVIAWRSNN